MSRRLNLLIFVALVAVTQAKEEKKKTLIISVDDSKPEQSDAVISDLDIGEQSHSPSYQVSDRAPYEPQPVRGTAVDKQLGYILVSPHDLKKLQELDNVAVEKPQYVVYGETYSPENYDSGKPDYSSEGEKDGYHGDSYSAPPDSGRGNYYSGPSNGDKYPARPAPPLSSFSEDNNKSPNTYQSNSVHGNAGYSPPSTSHYTPQVSSGPVSGSGYYPAVGTSGNTAYSSPPSSNSFNSPHDSPGVPPPAQYSSSGRSGSYGNRNKATGPRYYASGRTSGAPYLYAIYRTHKPLPYGPRYYSSPKTTGDYIPFSHRPKTSSHDLPPPSPYSGAPKSPYGGSSKESSYDPPSSSYSGPSKPSSYVSSSSYGGSLKPGSYDSPTSSYSGPPKPISYDSPPSYGSYSKPTSYDSPTSSYSGPSKPSSYDSPSSYVGSSRPSSYNSQTSSYSSPSKPSSYSSSGSYDGSSKYESPPSSYSSPSKPSSYDSQSSYGGSSKPSSYDSPTSSYSSPSRPNSYNSPSSYSGPSKPITYHPPSSYSGSSKPSSYDSPKSSYSSPSKHSPYDSPSSYSGPSKPSSYETPSSYSGPSRPSTYDTPSYSGPSRPSTYDTPSYSGPSKTSSYDLPPSSPYSGSSKPITYDEPSSYSGPSKPSSYDEPTSYSSPSRPNSYDEHSSYNGPSRPSSYDGPTSYTVSSKPNSYDAPSSGAYGSRTRPSSYDHKSHSNSRPESYSGPSSSGPAYSSEYHGSPHSDYTSGQGHSYNRDPPTHYEDSYSSKGPEPTHYTHHSPPKSSYFTIDDAIAPDDLPHHHPRKPLSGSSSKPEAPHYDDDHSAEEPYHHSVKKNYNPMRPAPLTDDFQTQSRYPPLPAPSRSTRDKPNYQDDDEDHGKERDDIHGSDYKSQLPYDSYRSNKHNDYTHSSNPKSLEYAPAYPSDNVRTYHPSSTDSSYHHHPDHSSEESDHQEPKYYTKTVTTTYTKPQVETSGDQSYEGDHASKSTYSPSSSKSQSSSHSSGSKTDYRPQSHTHDATPSHSRPYSEGGGRKFRYYTQGYEPETPNSPSSHQVETLPPKRVGGVVFRPRKSYPGIKRPLKSKGYLPYKAYNPKSSPAIDHKVYESPPSTKYSEGSQQISKTVPTKSGYISSSEEEDFKTIEKKKPTRPNSFEGSYDNEDSSLSAIPGEAGKDYPILKEVPHTGFSCHNRVAGFYADVEHRCQVYYQCSDKGRVQSFLCPNGTIFNQLTFVCEWWHNVDCSSSEKHFSRNNELYKPQAPRAPKPEGHVSRSRPHNPRYVPAAKNDHRDYSDPDHYVDNHHDGSDEKEARYSRPRPNRRRRSRVRYVSKSKSQ